MIKDNDKSGEFWNDTKTSLLGTKESWDVAPSGSIV